LLAIRHFAELSRRWYPAEQCGGKVNVTKMVVSMNAQGRLTIPVAAREALCVGGPAQFELEVTETALILRPAIVIPRDDAWAYAPDHLQRVERARREAREGRVRSLTEDDLKRVPTK
jgi:bifunctional DNA-binding transcriptional regulator/antitoxin component of YhaV-PrlF toxin-antitoxin module